MANKNKKANTKDDDSFNKTEIDLEDENNDVLLENSLNYNQEVAKVSVSKKDKGKKASDDTVIIPKSKIVLVKKLLSNIKENYERLSELLAVFVSEEDESRFGASQLSDEKFGKEKEEAGDGRVIEGVFDGETMIGPDGKQYSVPANYASKSKLVEGDILKLAITDRGTFIYKQISPIERTRVIGKLEKAGDGIYYAVADGKKWRVLTASVTYFKGEPDDEIVVIISKTGESKWAAVENIIRSEN